MSSMSLIIKTNRRMQFFFVNFFLLCKLMDHVEFKFTMNKECMKN